MVRLEESCWRQKSRELWLKERDRYTRFFIRWIIPVGEKKDRVSNAFKRLLFESKDWLAWNQLLVKRLIGNWGFKEFGSPLFQKRKSS